jgi:hypothetical protein
MPNAIITEKRITKATSSCAKIYREGGKNMLINIALLVAVVIVINLVVSRIWRLHGDYSYIRQDVNRFIDRNQF